MVFFCALVVVGLLTVYNLWEWYAVEKLNQIEGYSFGDVTDRAYYFQSQTLYAFIHLFWGICFGVSLILLALNFLFKVRWFKAVSLGLAFLMIGIYIYHWVVA